MVSIQITLKMENPLHLNLKSKYVIHDILSNNSDYLHFLKYGANEKDLNHMNKINENLFYFIKNEITDSTDYETALTNYYLYFLVNSNVEE